MDSVSIFIALQIWGMILHVDEIPEHYKNYDMNLKIRFGLASADLFPSWPEHLGNLDRLHLPEDKLTQIKGVLYIFSNTHPNMEPSPMVLSLIGILSVYMEADQVLGCMTSIIWAHSNAAIDRSQWAYFPSTRRESLIFERVFKLLVKEHESTVYAHIKSLTAKFGVHDLNWDPLLGSMFVKLLPKKVVMRIVDCFLIEGFKIIYRMALAHLHLRRSIILAARTIDELKAAIFDGEHAHSKDLKEAMFARAFSYSLGHAKITKLKRKAKKSALADCDRIDRQQLVFKRPLPKLTIPSAFLENEELIALWSWIPSRLRDLDLDMVFSTDKHGFSLQTLYHKCEEYDKLIMVIETADEQILGAFLTSPLVNRRRHFIGTGETFIFTLAPACKTYCWTPSSGSTSFILATDDLMAFGAGSSGFGLLIDAGLTTIESSPTGTFGNPALLQPTTILGIEVYSFL